MFDGRGGKKVLWGGLRDRWGMSPSRRGVRGRLSRSGGLNWLRGRWGLCLRARMCWWGWRDYL